MLRVSGEGGHGEEELMSQWDQHFQAAKSESTLLVLFIPSVDRNMAPIDQDHWLGEALKVLGTCFGGGTAFPRGRGGMARR